MHVRVVSVCDCTVFLKKKDVHGSEESVTGYQACDFLRYGNNTTTYSINIHKSGCCQDILVIICALEYKICVLQFLFKIIFKLSYNFNSYEFSTDHDCLVLRIINLGNCLYKSQSTKNNFCFEYNPLKIIDI